MFGAAVIVNLSYVAIIVSMIGWEQKVIKWGNYLMVEIAILLVTRLFIQKGYHNYITICFQGYLGFIFIFLYCLNSVEKTSSEAAFCSIGGHQRITIANAIYFLPYLILPLCGEKGRLKKIDICLLFVAFLSLLPHKAQSFLRRLNAWFWISDLHLLLCFNPLSASLLWPIQKSHCWVLEFSCAKQFALPF